MEIIDLEDSYEHLYCSCLEDWSAEMREAGDYKRRWLERKKPEGLRVKLARESGGRIVGMIHYAPAEKAPVIGAGLYYIYCVWVHGYRQGVGNFQGRGVGSLLLAAAEADARALGAQGIVAWGLRLPLFMRSTWFKKRGYTKVDADGMLELVWKPFSEAAVPPRLYKLRKKPERAAGSVRITCLRNGWCPAQNLTVERIERLVAEYPGRIDYRLIDTEDRRALEEWGAADAVFLDDRQIRVGPPPSYRRLKQLVERRLRAR